MDIATALQMVRNELEKAKKQYPAFASPHEGLAIIEEEFLELRREVFLNHKVRVPEQMIKEAMQTAAMSIRFMVDLDNADSRK